MMEMESFSLFYEEPMAFWWDEEVPQWEQPAPAEHRSAFGKYEGENGRMGGERKKNVHMRVVEYLRTIPVQRTEKPAMEYSKSMRHMMRERRRRERLSQCYADLYRMVLPQPKTDKNSIVQAAAEYLRSLKNTRDALEQRRHKLSVARRTSGGAISSGGAAISEGGATIKFRVSNPSSAVDSMIAALQRLKGLGVSVRSISSGAVNRELFAAIDVQTELAIIEVETTVQDAARNGRIEPSRSKYVTRPQSHWVEEGEILGYTSTSHWPGFRRCPKAEDSLAQIWTAID